MPRSTVATNGPIAQEEYRPLRGGELCLDFVNTVGAPDSAMIPSYDYLTPGYANLLAWSQHAGIVDERVASSLRRVARKEGRQAASVRRRAIVLRDAIRTIVHALRNNIEAPSEAIQTLSDELDIAQAAQRLILLDGRLVRVLSDRPDLDALLWPVTMSAIELLGSARVERIGECQAEGCGWLFMDTSKNHSRRFCSSTGCGNTARIRRFRERHAVSR